MKLLMKKTKSTDSTFLFSETAFAKQNQSCQEQRFVEYKWLDYNNVTCFISKKHLQKLDPEKNREDPFLCTGLCNWIKVLISFRDYQQ